MQIHSLGAFEAIQASGEPVIFRTNKVQALLVYLLTQSAMHPQQVIQPHRRDVLMELLWPGLPLKSAQVNLRQIAYRLRKDVNAPAKNDDNQVVQIVVGQRSSLKLNPEAAIQYDLADFVNAAHRVNTHQHTDIATCSRCRSSLETMSQLYQGVFLENFYLADSNEFEEWASAIRETIRNQASDSLSTLAQIYLGENNFTKARESAEKLTVCDPLNQNGHRLMMEALAQSGQRAAALAQYDTYKRLLAQEMGMMPETRISELYNQIHAGEIDLGQPAKKYDEMRGYKILEELGTGAFGNVYRAHQPSVARDVAIKVIKPQFANNNEFIRRFEFEAQVVAQLEHPHVVPLYDYWRQADGAFLVMRFLRGGTLREAVADTPWSLKRTLSLLEQVAAGLDAAHRLGIIHRDVNPNNIMLDEVGNAYVTDFGIARAQIPQTQLTATGGLVGTLDYISPEQIRNESITPQTDIYGLGMVLYYALSSEKPYASSTTASLIYNHLEDPVPQLYGRIEGVPNSVDEIIAKATAKKPADRYDTITALATAFKAVVENSPVPLEPDVGNSDSTNPHNLPSPQTPFFGRKHELAQVDELLQNRDIRLITIVGTGGMGKTRLSLKAAENQLKNNRFADGVYFVPLAQINSAENIIPAIAQAIDCPIEIQSLRPVKAQLIEHLKTRSLLLVLDNFEHLLEGVPLVNDLLTDTQTVTILTSSRERLQLQSETLLPLLGLGSFDLASRDAVDLFVSRVRRGQRDYTPSEQEELQILKLCAFLGGMPLAVELAAGWMDMLGLDEIIEEMQDDLNFLETELRDIPERHRSMRVVWEGTWHRLNSAEKAIFAQLTLFRGGFTRAVAKAVTGASIRQLASLTNKCLLHFDRTSKRYAIHQLLLQFGSDQLQPQQRNEALQKLAAFFINFIRPDEFITPDIENILLATDWALQNNPVSLIKLDGAYSGQKLVLLGQSLMEMTRAKEAVGYLEIGHQLLKDQAKSKQLEPDHFELQLTLGTAYWQIGDIVKATSTYHSAIEMSRQITNPTAMARAVLAYEEPRWRFNLGIESSQKYMWEALKRLGQTKTGLRARLLVFHARSLISTGSVVELRTIVDEALTIARQVNDSKALCDALRISAQIDRSPATLEARLEATREMILVADSINDKLTVCDAVSLHAYDQLELGNYEVARQFISRQNQLADEIKLPFQDYMALIFKIMWKILFGEFELAEQMANKAADLATALGVSEFDGIFGIQMFIIRSAQGRLHEIAPLLRFHMANNPSTSSWGPGLALIYASIGEREACHEIFERLSFNQFDSIARDSLWLTSMVYLAEVAIFLEDGAQAQVLYELIQPYHNLTVVVGAATACYGSADRYLGMLADFLGHEEQAQTHFETALQNNTSLKARPWLALTQFHYAKLLLTREKANDLKQARKLLDTAFVTAQQIGMGGLQHQILSIQEKM